MKKAIAVFVICCVVAAFADNPHITMLAELVDVALSSPADGDVLTFSAATGKWANKPLMQPVIPDGPKIVLKYQQDNVSGIFPDTPFFTPDETGLYRVNIYVAPVGSGGSSTGGGVVVSTADDNGVFNQMFDRFGPCSGLAQDHTGMIRAVAGQPVNISAAEPFSCPYSFYVVVEKM